MHVQSNGGWLGGWLGGRLGGWLAGRPKPPPPPPLASAAPEVKMGRECDDNKQEAHNEPMKFR